MPEPGKNGGIEIAQDLEFQKKSWRVQRIAWKVMLGIAVAALLGVFGSGPVSSASTPATDAGVAANYERFIRAGGEHSLGLVVTPAAIDDDSSVVIWMASDWLAGNLVLAITPQPESETAQPDRISYRFAVAELSSPVEVRFTLESRKPGLRRWRGGVEGDAVISFTQLVYP
jgi:hypothetical protein